MCSYGAYCSQGILTPQATVEFMATSDSDKLEIHHVQAITELAKEADCAVDVVNRIYASELSNLKASARINEYLIVLAYKRVRDTLHHL